MNRSPKITRPLILTCAALLLLPLLAHRTPTMAQEVDPALYSALSWRLIGPYRGGRSQAVAGVPSRTDEYWFGATGGGVWKTTDGGEDWECVSDGFFGTASVGAIAVSLSDPNIVYVGTGETQIRGNTAHGDGVYKSTDSGETWTHLGLTETSTVARLFATFLMTSKMSRMICVLPMISPNPYSLRISLRR